MALASYTGAGSIDVAGGANAQGGGGTTVTTPGETTSVNGDWAVYAGGGAPGGGSNFTVPAGTTTRQSVIFPLLASGLSSLTVTEPLPRPVAPLSGAGHSGPPIRLLPYG